MLDNPAERGIIVKICSGGYRAHRHFKRALTIYSLTGSQAVLFVAFTCIGTV